MSDDVVDYATWGESFFTSAVSLDRVLAGVDVLAGHPIDVGPVGIGPGRMIRIRATGSIGRADGERLGEDPVTFRVSVPVALEFAIVLGLETQRFAAEMSVPLVLTARARRDLAILLDVTPPTADEVAVRVEAQGVRASITKRVADVEGELRRFVSSYVARELDKPEVVAARVIDVSGAIDKALTALGAGTPRATELTSDLPTALEAEIREHETLFTDNTLLP